MLSPRVLVAIVAFAFTALATNSTCWYVLPIAYFMLASKWQWSGQIANTTKGRKHRRTLLRPRQRLFSHWSDGKFFLLLAFVCHTAMADQQAQIVILARKRTNPRRQTRRWEISFLIFYGQLVCAKDSTGIDEMIFYDACYPPDIEVRSVSGRGTCRCLPDGESDCATE